MTGASSIAARIPRRAATTTTRCAPSSASSAIESRALEPALGARRRRGTVGIGIPGAISPATGFIKNANSTWLNGRPLADDLSRALGRPVRLANDANCFALSEATDGAAAGAAVVFGVIIGTGTGGGLVVHGRLVVGANAIAGEWGHNPLPAPADDERPGPQCYCGRSGCIETFLSGPGLSRDYVALGGDDVPAAEMAARADAWRGRVPARASSATSAASPAPSRRSSTWLDPDVIVLGGGLSNIERLYDRVPRLWGAYVFPIASTRASFRPDTATPAASAARPGSGTKVRRVRRMPCRCVRCVGCVACVGCVGCVGCLQDLH